MIEPVSSLPAAGEAAAVRTGTPVARAAAAAGSKSFAGELARASSTTAPADKAPARPEGERTEMVKGHPFARIETGADKGLFLNRLSNSPREGQAFKLVERDGRVFHVYGSGKDKVVAEIKSDRADAAKPGAAKTEAAKPDAAKTEAAKTEAAKPNAAKPHASTPDLPTGGTKPKTT